MTEEPPTQSRLRRCTDVQKPGVWGNTKELMRGLNNYAALLNVVLGVIGAIFLVNEWQNREAETRIKAIEALSGTASQSRAAILYLVQIGADLAHQNLTGVNAGGLSIEGAVMADVRLDNANLIDARLTGDLSALSVRCADISNLVLRNTHQERPIDARGARLGGFGAPVKTWDSSTLYTPTETLKTLGKNIGRGMAGEIAVAEYFEKKAGAQAEESLPYCLYDRLKSQGVDVAALCAGGVTWDGVTC